MYIGMFSVIRSFIYSIIDKIGKDTFISISVLLWGYFIYNILRKGTRL